jgi:uncharacterized protein (DUF1800 family)
MSLALSFIAANRFGYGANPLTIKAIGNEPQDWLLAQLQPSVINQLTLLIPNLWTSQQAIIELQQYQKLKTQSIQNRPINTISSNQTTMIKLDRQRFMQKIEHLSELTIYQGSSSAIPFYWHLVDFFANHFSVSGVNVIMKALAPTLDIEAIAPNILNHFSDLLFAVESHPAMLNYLNNVQSIGPSTRFAKKRTDKGLNENLAREILELHTLGVESTYTQNDVTELAKAITGWSVSSLKRQESAGFLFRDHLHEPGPRTLLGKAYSQSGMEQGKAMLLDLANHPDTAKHICTKLVQHFISDQPDPTIIQAMVLTWLNTQGNLPNVLASMIKHPASWLPTAVKLKTPRELVISVCRSCNIQQLRPNALKSLQTLGQEPFNAGSPAGYKDVESAWSGPSAFLNRIEWLSHVSRFITHVPEQLAIDALGPLLRPSTVKQMSQAESKQQALTLLLMSPEFQRR